MQLRQTSKVHDNGRLKSLFEPSLEGLTESTPIFPYPAPYCGSFTRGAGSEQIVQGLSSEQVARIHHAA